MTAREVADSAELNHRIRRLLAMIRTIAVHMQVQGRDAEESAVHLAGRVGAIGRMALTPIAAGVDLESLVLDELLVHRAHRSGITVEGPEVRLNAKSAELVGLLIHELVTNSLKFGALSQLQTQLCVVWLFSGLEDSRLHIEWRESGVRMPLVTGKKPGFGSQVVKRLIASELHGEGDMLFLREGVLCTIEFPAGEALLAYE
ncbi:MAG TPA: sensor histidine kinase [Steroidobacteraceae bacterium]|jgi:two-component sensor histidine kinase|nr:sensor histidine kinase [Steroidobacteraceae bacterium]